MAEHGEEAGLRAEKKSRKEAEGWAQKGRKPINFIRAGVIDGGIAGVINIITVVILLLN